MMVKEEKAHVVTLRISASEHAAIRAAAANAGMTPSAFMRSLALDGAGVRPFLNDDDRAIWALILEDLRKIGVNLNQIAAAINSKKMPVAEEVAIHHENVLQSHAAIFQELKRMQMRIGRKVKVEK